MKKNTVSKKSRAKKFSDITETHGKKEFTPTSLEEIWGERNEKYPVDNVDDYINYISELNKTDLQAHAKRIGLVPTEDVERLTKRLVYEFNRSAASKTPLSAKRHQNTNIPPEIEKVLSEGR